MTDLCSTCGAYWECEHRQKRTALHWRLPDEPRGIDVSSPSYDAETLRLLRERTDYDLIPPEPLP